MRNVLCLGLTAALTLATAALAADGPGPDRMGRMDRGARADANGDGRVTLQESQAALRERILRFDANRDGKVTRAEMDGAREQMRARREERREQRGDEAFARLDADHNGQLSQSEFNAGRAEMRERRRERWARGGERAGPGRMGHPGPHRGAPGERFERLDADRDGAVSAAELDRAAAERFSQMDANHDGALTPDERPMGRGRR